VVTTRIATYLAMMLALSCGASSFCVASPVIADIASTWSYDRSSRLYTYTYELTNAPDSPNPVEVFGLRPVAQPLSILSPPGWKGFRGWAGDSSAVVWAVIDPGPAPEHGWRGQLYVGPYELQPGKRVNGFQVVSDQPPDSTGTFVAQGFDTIPGGAHTFAPRAVRKRTLWEQGWAGTAVVPAAPAGAGAPRATGSARMMRPRDWAAPPVQVMVTKKIVPEGVSYRYHVVNGSPYPIWNLIVGYDASGDEPELSTIPVGATTESDGNGARIGSPDGWRGDIVPEEGDTRFTLAWEVDTTRSPRLEILGGQEAIFGVTVPRADFAYESGHWAVYLNSWERNVYAGRIQSGTWGELPAVGMFALNGIQVLQDPAHDAVRISFDEASKDSKVEILDDRGDPIRSLRFDPRAHPRVTILWDGQDDSGRLLGRANFYVRVRDSRGERFAGFVWQE
jgi:hypothetical protein